MFSYAPLVSGAEETAELQEVQVTGSRILRRDYESNSPLVSVEAESLENRSGLNIESYLNQLPQFNPATTPTTAQFDVQITPVNSVGISSISLRGFGPNRNLVLVDGHRSVPINALMVTDINYIPSALIERVEIISGGASAVYGADAIGGVTNFITRNNFEGAEFDVQYGMAEAGDNETFRAYALFGTNFAEGRGNVTFETEYYDRDPAYRRNRSFFTDSFDDPTVGSPDFFVFGYNGFNSAFSFNPPNVATLNALFPDRVPYTSGPATGTTTQVRGFGNTFGVFEGFRFNNDGSVFATGSGDNLAKYLKHGGAIDDGQYYRQHAYDGTISQPGQVIDVLKWYNPDAYTSSPQTRHSMYASGTFDITDSVTAFARGTFATSTTKTRLFPANASFGWEATIPYNPTIDSPLLPTLAWTNPAVVQAAIADPTNPLYRNPNFRPTGSAPLPDPDGPGPLTAPLSHPVSVEMSALMNSRAVPGAGWILETYPKDSFDDRATVNTNQVWQMEGGLRFDIPWKDWTGEAYFAHGESDTYNQASGNNSLSRWRALVTTNDYGRNAAISGNQNGASVGFGAGDITCGSGFYGTIFGGDAVPSQDCIDAVGAVLQTNTHNKQEIGELNFQGGLFNLPAGEVRAAAGFQYRKNWAHFTPDILQSERSFTDQVIGVYPTGYLDVSTSVRDYYAELLVPVLSDLPFLKKLELELGGRYSDYEDTDSTFTWKATANIEINDWFRVRGGYNKATRAPNLGELFLNTQEFFGVSGNFGDACSLRSNAPYGAGGAAPDPQPGVPAGEPPLPNPIPPASGQTAAGATSAYLICRAQMTPQALLTFYDSSTSNAVAPGPGGGFAWLLQQGNPNLESEVADTWTAGIVMTSHAENPWLSGISTTIDWYKVDINNAIQQYSTDYAAYLCYGAVHVTNATEAAAQANSEACRNTPRNAANGGALNALIKYTNQATISTSGLDVGINWIVGFGDVGMDKVPGRFGINMQASFLDYYKTKTSPANFDVETDWKGTFGPTLAGTNGGSYNYRLFTTFSYILEDMSFGLTWRHLPSIWSARHASEEAIIANNKAVSAGAPGAILSYTPSTEVKVDSYDIFDLNFNWNLNKTLSLRAGVSNLFNTEPAVTGTTKGYPYDPAKTLAQNAAALAGVCAGAVGCINPTAYSLANSGAGTTNAGYYDTIGRQYYIGLKARF